MPSTTESLPLRGFAYRSFGSWNSTVSKEAFKKKPRNNHSARRDSTPEIPRYCKALRRPRSDFGRSKRTRKIEAGAQWLIGDIDDGHEGAVFLGTMVEIELGAMVEIRRLAMNRATTVRRNNFDLRPLVPRTPSVLARRVTSNQHTESSSPLL